MFGFLFGFVFHTAATAAVFWALQHMLLVGNFEVSSEKGLYFGLILIAIVFGLINTFIKPLIELITLPFRLFSFGLVSFGIHVGMVILLQFVLTHLDVFGTNLTVTGIENYLIAGIVLALTNTVIHWLS